MKTEKIPMHDAKDEEKRIELADDTSKGSHDRTTGGLVTVDNGAEIVIAEADEAETRRILRKIDYRLVPLLAYLYLVAFVDRSNSESCSFPCRQSAPFAKRSNMNRSTSSILLIKVMDSWKCQNRRSHPGSQDEPEKSAVQHSCNTVLRPIYNPRSSQQHYPKDDAPFTVDSNPYVLLGFDHDVSLRDALAFNNKN